MIVRITTLKPGELTKYYRLLRKGLIQVKIDELGYTVVDLDQLHSTSNGKRGRPIASFRADSWKAYNEWCEINDKKKCKFDTLQEYVKAMNLIK